MISGSQLYEFAVEGCADGVFLDSLSFPTFAGLIAEHELLTKFLFELIGAKVGFQLYDHRVELLFALGFVGWRGAGEEQLAGDQTVEQLLFNADLVFWRDVSVLGGSVGFNRDKQLVEL